MDDSAHAESLLRNVLQVLGPEHPVAALEAMVVAQRLDCDDVLVQTTGQSFPLFIIRLGYYGHREGRNAEIRIKVVASWDEWARIGPSMSPDEMRPSRIKRPTSEPLSLEDERRDQANRLYLEGCQAFEQQQWTAALNLFDQAIECDRSFALAHNGRSAALQNLGRHEEALEPAEEAIRLDPTLWKAYLSRGAVYATQGDVDQALSDYGHALELRPDCEFAFGLRGHLYGETGRHAEALSDLSKAIYRAPLRSDYRVNRVHVFEAVGEFDGALDDLDEVISLRPDDSSLYLHRGHVNFAAGRYLAASSDFGQVIQRTKADAYLLTCLSVALREAGDLELAMKHVCQAIEIADEPGIEYIERAVIYFRQNLMTEAIDDLTEAIRRDASCVRAYRLRGKAWEKLGDTQNAEADFDRALQLEDAP